MCLSNGSGMNTTAEAQYEYIGKILSYFLLFLDILVEYFCDISVLSQLVNLSYYPNTKNMVFIDNEKFIQNKL